MTQNYHNAIALAAPADASIFNAPLGQLDAQISANTAAIAADVANLAALVAGNSSFTQLNFGTATTVTLSGNVMAITRSTHKVDTQGAAATDELDNITGGVEGDVLYISSVSSARVVEVRNDGLGAGNIRTPNGGSIYLDDPDYQLRLYNDGTNWVAELSHIALTDSIGSTLAYGKGFKVPYGVLRTDGLAANDHPYLSIAARFGKRIVAYERAAAATYAAVGMATGTSAGAGALSEQNAADTVFVQQAIGAVSGTFGGRRSTTFDLCRKTHYPYFSAVIQIPAVITNIRGYFGLCAAQVTNVDNLVTSFLGLRYSSVAPDAAWMACVSDGANTVVLTTGVGIAADTTYLLEGWWDGTSWWASVNGSEPVSITSASVPADATELGWTASLITTTASAKNLWFSRAGIESN